MPKYDINKPNPGQLNSVQLNVVTVVDLQKAASAGSLNGALYMMDNSLSGDGQGTGELQTVCKRGQVINWIIYPMDAEKRPDGTWPPMPKINNIVFLDDDEGDYEDVAELKVCTEFKIYGGPDLMRSPLTPTYYYWAATVLSNLPIGVYNYRFIIELQQEGVNKNSVYLNTQQKPSLRVISV